MNHLLKFEESLILEDILSPLNDSMINENKDNTFKKVLDKVKHYAKKGLLSAVILSSLLATPNLSQAQKSQIHDQVKTEQSYNDFKQVRKNVTYKEIKDKLKRGEWEGSDVWLKKFDESTIFTEIRCVTNISGVGFSTGISVANLNNISLTGKFGQAGKYTQNLSNGQIAEMWIIPSGSKEVEKVKLGDKIKSEFKKVGDNVTSVFRK